MISRKNFVKYSWFNVFYLVLVIVWGAVVRITGSGAGCGAHWPKCNGDVVPIDPSLETLIEFGHRLTSGLSIFIVLALVFFSVKLFEKGHLVRKAAYGTLFFLLVEAAIGAALVLNEWVADNASSYRAFMSALHLTNTFFLLGFAGAAAFISSIQKSPKFDSSLRYPERKQIVFIAGLFLLVGMSGAIVALGDTLFPSSSVLEGLKEDFSSDSHFLIRLRVLHPIIAVVTSLFIFVFARQMRKIRFYFGSSHIWQQLELLVVTQMAIGVLNWLLLAPSWLQISHLVFADLIWIRLVTAGLSLFLVPQIVAEKSKSTLVRVLSKGDQKERAN